MKEHLVDTRRRTVILNSELQAGMYGRDDWSELVCARARV